MNATQYISFNNGATFGRLYYQYVPDLTNERLDFVARTLRLRNKQSPEYFVRGFISSYRYLRLKSEVANQSPEGEKSPEGGRVVTSYHSSLENELLINDELELERKNGKMGKLKDAAKRVASETSKQLNMSMLSEAGADFCIRDIREVDSPFGATYVLDLQIDEEYCAALGVENEDRQAVLFVQKGNRNRDSLLESLMAETPIHRIYIKGVTLRSGNPFFSFEEIDPAITRLCACGDLEEEAATNQGVTEAKPF